MLMSQTMRVSSNYVEVRCFLLHSVNSPKDKMLLGDVEAGESEHGLKASLTSHVCLSHRMKSFPLRRREEIRERERGRVGEGEGLLK